MNKPGVVLISTLLIVMVEEGEKIVPLLARFALVDKYFTTTFSPGSGDLPNDIPSPKFSS